MAKKASDTRALEAEVVSLKSKLADKIVECEDLRQSNSRLKTDIAHEMDVNERLNELNVELKGKINNARRLMKVRVLPSAMDQLHRTIDEKRQAITLLRDALDLAIRLIPEGRMRRMHIPGLKKVYREVF